MAYEEERYYQQQISKYTLVSLIVKMISLFFAALIIGIHSLSNRNILSFFIFGFAILDAFSLHEKLKNKYLYEKICNHAETDFQKKNHLKQVLFSPAIIFWYGVLFLVSFFVVLFL